MNVNLSKFMNKGNVVGVATSGGRDSMALLHFLFENSKKNGYYVIAINVEHGIRGQDSINDSAFVKEYCNKKNIEFVGYSVNALEYSKKHKTTVEESARILRYECFYDALSKGKIDFIATAHHQSDNAESVLLNLFRGTGVSGIAGIKENINGKILRPFLNITRHDIDEYVKKNNIPYVFDTTNDCLDYTRNFLRHNVMPQIKKIFPEAEKSILRFSEIATYENDYLNEVAEKTVVDNADGSFSVSLSSHKAIFCRSIIKAMIKLGITQDWTKNHVDAVWALTTNLNGDMVSLPKNISAVREYDKITLYKNYTSKKLNIPFALGIFNFEQSTYSIDKVKNVSLHSGLFADLDKIPQSATIRTKLDGDVFKKFNGGTKSLGDYFTDKKIPLRLRDKIPLIANGSEILAIFNHAISDKIKVDETTKTTIQLKKSK